MKKIIFIFGLIAFLAFFAGYAGNTVKKEPVMSSTIKTETKKSEVVQKESFWSGHEKQSIDCKTCHNCEYPTKNDPCLIACPKDKMISVHHKPEEGPEIVYMNEIKGNSGYVIFSHKMHSQMAEMSGRCSSCHHYNTTGPVLKCSKCHESERKREDISKPDLTAAYHRQCMNCHRQWEGKVQCGNCHIPDGVAGEAKKNEIIKLLTGKSHPKVQEPIKIVYDTKYDNGRYVTFFHDQHIKNFNLDCIKCHQDNNCTKCHSKATAGHFLASNEPVKVHKSLGEHHKPCITCHANDKCSNCHAGQEKKEFDHAKSTGFALAGFHEKLTCNSCHKNSNFSNLNKDCNSCHSNFAMGKFNHKITGIVLSENHTEAECTNCHESMKFDKKPTCGGCHDDKSYPKDIPGKRVKLAKR